MSVIEHFIGSLNDTYSIDIHRPANVITTDSSAKYAPCHQQLPCCYNSAHIDQHGHIEHANRVTAIKQTIFEEDHKVSNPVVSLLLADSIYGTDVLCNMPTIVIILAGLLACVLDTMDFGVTDILSNQHQTLHNDS